MSCRRWVAIGFAVCVLQFCWSPDLRAQGGPPYYTTDPGTPGPNSWEINLGWMPFFYNGQSTSHVPDLDVNYGVGERIQLTYENAWLRDRILPDPAKYGIGQDNVGVKWRFYDDDKKGLGISIFPQGFINNPNHSVDRGITPAGSSFLMPMEFTKHLGPIDLNWEEGYTVAHHGPPGFISGVVVGHDVTKKLEVDGEFFASGAFNGSNNQNTLDFGARLKLTPPFILLVMAGRSAAPASATQPFFVGYFGMQFLLPRKPFED